MAEIPKLHFIEGELGLFHLEQELAPCNPDFRETLIGMVADQEKKIRDLSARLEKYEPTPPKVCSQCGAETDTTCPGCGGCGGCC